MICTGHPRKPVSKRKLTNANQKSRKKVKTHHTTDNLPWKRVSRPAEAGLDGDDDVLELEEVDDVEVVYEETEGGRVARFQVIDRENESGKQDAEPSQRVKSPSDVRSQEEKVDLTDEPETIPFDSVGLLPEWHRFSLHPHLLRSIHSQHFDSPTSIQAAALPVALAGKDVVGVAQTGSGKTLAYGLPVLHRFLSQPRPKPGRRRPVQALILAPTRELVLQVCSHLKACLIPVKECASDPAPRTSQAAGTNDTLHSNAEKDTFSALSKTPPHVSVAAIVGGMSAQKQRRILDRGVDVLVATPGRLWDIMEDDDTLSKDIKNLKYLVLDEADRMIETGHFAELNSILRLTLREVKEEKIPNGSDTSSDEEEGERRKEIDGLQTFVFSATMSKDLQKNVKKRSRPKKVGKHYDKPASTLDDLLLRLDFRDTDPTVIDLSPKGGVVSTLQESKIDCLTSDKDVYLYYFLLRYPGRTLVFLSSIDGIRRLMPLLELLNIRAFPLHSQLEQRQRLKNLDRFKSIKNSVLLATDIAARGLDIPAVDHVIHYQVPRSADAYIHRNGRTARAMRKGFSMLMCAPDERRVLRAVLGNMKRQEEEIPEMSMDLSIIDQLKTRVQLARKIDVEQHKAKKSKFEKNWMKETAEAMEIELDSDFVSDEDGPKPKTKKLNTKNAQAAALKAELKELLSKPLVSRGVSAKYLTSGSKPIVDDLLAGNLNESIIGMKNSEAGSQLVKKRKKPTRPENEQWNGITEES